MSMMVLHNESITMHFAMRSSQDNLGIVDKIE